MLKNNCCIFLRSVICFLIFPSRTFFLSESNTNYQQPLFGIVRARVKNSLIYADMVFFLLFLSLSLSQSSLIFFHNDRLIDKEKKYFFSSCSKQNKREKQPNLFF